MRSVPLVTISLVLGILLGYASAIYALDYLGTKRVADGVGWLEWQLDKKQAVSIYATAHFLTAGELPPPAAKNQALFRQIDDDGKSLDGNCIYVFKGKLPAARWWSVILSSGSHDPTLSSPQINAENAVTLGDGTLEIAISKYPQAGNWLRPENDGAFVLHYVISDVQATDAPAVLPKLIRTDC